MERQGASHRITSSRPGSGNSTDQPRSTRPIEKWKGTSPWEVSDPALGQLHTVASDPDEYGEHGLTAWSGGGGYVGHVEHHEPVGGGWEAHTYQTPAFRTPMRAQIGAEALSRRITKRGVTDPYYVGTKFESYED
jgi:hypothetical protein